MNVCTQGTSCGIYNAVAARHRPYSDVIMSSMASQTTGVSIVYAIVCSGIDQRKYQSYASLAFVRGIHRWLVNSPHKGPVTRKMLPFNYIIMETIVVCNLYVNRSALVNMIYIQNTSDLLMRPGHTLHYIPFYISSARRFVATDASRWLLRKI